MVRKDRVSYRMYAMRSYVWKDCGYIMQKNQMMMLLQKFKARDYRNRINKAAIKVTIIAEKEAGFKPAAAPVARTGVLVVDEALLTVLFPVGRIEVELEMLVNSPRAELVVLSTEVEDGVLLAEITTLLEVLVGLLDTLAGLAVTWLVIPCVTTGVLLPCTV